MALEGLRWAFISGSPLDLEAGWKLRVSDVDNVTSNDSIRITGTLHPIGDV